MSSDGDQDTESSILSRGRRGGGVGGQGVEGSAGDARTGCVEESGSSSRCAMALWSTKSCLEPGRGVDELGLDLLSVFLDGFCGFWWM